MIKYNLEKNPEKVQREVNNHARTVRDTASIARSAWEEYISHRDRDHGLKVQDKLKRTEYYSEDAAMLLDRISKSDLEVVDQIDEISGIEDEYEDPYEALRTLDRWLEREQELDAVYVDPLQVARYDFAKLHMRIVSNPMYRDLERQEELERNFARAEMLQDDVDEAAENLGFVVSELEAAVEKSNIDNIEETQQDIAELALASHHCFVDAVEIKRDVANYRRENGLTDAYKSTHAEDSFFGEETVPDVDTGDLEMEIRDYHSIAPDISELPIGPDLLDLEDDAEILED